MPLTRLGTLGIGLGAMLLVQAETANAQVARRVSQVAVSSAAAASVRNRRVVLLDPPEILARALQTALSPWGMQLERVRRQKPADTLPGTALQASALARQLDAEALVWLSVSADGAVLWLYEASKDTIRARPFENRSLDRARAAALALSVKTWLRTEEPAAEPAPSAASVVESPRELGASSDAGSAAPSAVRAPSPDAAARLQVLVNVAARRGLMGPSGMEARYGLEARASAWRSPNETTRFQLAARIETGAPFDVTAPELRGIYSDLSGALMAGVAEQLAPVFGMALYMGAVLSRTSLSGTLLSDGTPVEANRWGAALQLRPEAEFCFGPLGVLVQPALVAAPGRQSYTADGQEVLKTSTVWWMVGGALRLDLL
jgi:hypothetical protein